MKFESLLDELAGDLNDSEEGREYTTWSKKQLRAWVREGFNLIFDNRPDLFMENKIVQVTPCSTRQDTCDCDEVRRVLGQVTKSGRLLRHLRQRALEISFQWTAPACRRRQTGADFPLESYALDEVSGALYIWPQVPPGVEVYVELECSVRPDELADSADIDIKFIAAIKQWVLWRAKSVDMEISQAAFTAATKHEASFWHILGIQRDAQVVIHKKDNS